MTHPHADSTAGNSDGIATSRDMITPLERGAGRMSRSAWRRAHISVVVPVKNEELSIPHLLEGLAGQSLRPAEIVIADGGSSDRTREVVRRYAQSSIVPLVLVEDENALPGRGRNLAIVRASNEWVACIDAGIVPHADWLRELARTAEFEPDAGVIYGRYEAVTDTYFTECAAIVYASPGAGETTRSIASCLLRREAWEAAGRFREDLRSSEDLLFFKRLDEAGVRAAYSRAAVVYWSLQPTSAATFRRMAVYSRNGMKAGLASEWQWAVSRLYALMLAAMVAGFFFWPLLLLPPALLLLRAERRVMRWSRPRGRARLLAEMLNPRRVLTVAYINVLIDAATFRGMLDWLTQDRVRVR